MYSPAAEREVKNMSNGVMNREESRHRRVNCAVL